MTLCQTYLSSFGTRVPNSFILSLILYLLLRSTERQKIQFNIQTIQSNYFIPIIKKRKLISLFLNLKIDFKKKHHKNKHTHACFYLSYRYKTSFYLIKMIKMIKTQNKNFLHIFAMK